MGRHLGWEFGRARKWRWSLEWGPHGGISALTSKEKEAPGLNVLCKVRMNPEHLAKMGIVTQWGLLGVWLEILHFLKFPGDAKGL